jgi:hypothetical protein
LNFLHKPPAEPEAPKTSHQSISYSKLLFAILNRPKATLTLAFNCEAEFFPTARELQAIQRQQPTSSLFIHKSSPTYEAMNGSSSLVHSGGSDAATILLKRARFQLMVEATQGAPNDGSTSALTLLSTLIQDPGFDVDDEYAEDDYVITPWNPITLHKQGFLRFASPLATSPQEMKVFKLITLGKSPILLNFVNADYICSVKESNISSRRQRSRKGTKSVPSGGQQRKH